MKRNSSASLAPNPQLSKVSRIETQADNAMEVDESDEQSTSLGGTPGRDNNGGTSDLVNRLSPEQDHLENQDHVIKDTAFTDFVLAYRTLGRLPGWPLLLHMITKADKELKTLQHKDAEELIGGDHGRHIIEALEAAWKTGNFEKVQQLAVLRSYGENKFSNEELDKFFDSNLNSFKIAFEGEYQSPHPRILLKTMDLYFPSSGDRYYNRSISIIQSSGTGKSRLADHTATLRFTLPFNLRGELDRQTYPPSDPAVLTYLTATLESRNSLSSRLCSFLEALFLEATKELENYIPGTPEDIAIRWYNWMKENSSAYTVGPNRKAFYERVIKHARQLEQPPNSANLPRSDSDRERIRIHQEESLKTAAGAFTKRLEDLHGKVEGFSSIVYFDEVHTLHRSNESSGQQPYFALMKTLSIISRESVFFVFLSTNSSLTQFALTDNTYPSIRLQKGSKLIPPFFELPYDSFSSRFTTEARNNGKLTLNGVCEIEQMAKFGRPMWYSHVVTLPDEKRFETIDLAMLKLRGNDFAKDHHAQYAALDSRVLLQYKPFRRNASEVQAKLVESYMRCVFNIPENREFMWSGFPSEPILSEAAARLLNEERNLDSKGRSIAHLAPEILAKAHNEDYLARGKRGELVARTLFTVAHDLATQMSQTRQKSQPYYHYPIRLVSLLETLMSPAVWQIVRNAAPHHADPSLPSLEVAFEQAWVNYSHFVQLGDQDTFNIKCASELLKRGAAMQTFDGQYNQDCGIPLHFGDPGTTDISEDTTSMLQAQIKNTSRAVNVHPDPLLIGTSAKKLPVLSIVMQLGVGQSEREKVRITTINKKRLPVRETRQNQPNDDVEQRHYIITLFGCTSLTYGCIPEGADYLTLLRAQKPSAGVPRKNQKDNLDAFYAFKPFMWGGTLNNFSWAK